MKKFCKWGGGQLVFILLFFALNTCALALFIYLQSWNFENPLTFLCDIFITDQKLEKAFCSNITPSLRTGSHFLDLLRPNCRKSTTAISFDWTVLRTWGHQFWATFLKLFSGIPNLPTFRHVTCVRYVTSHVTKRGEIKKSQMHKYRFGQTP